MRSRDYAYELNSRLHETLTAEYAAFYFEKFDLFEKQFLPGTSRRVMHQVFDAFFNNTYLKANINNQKICLN